MSRVVLYQLLAYVKVGGLTRRRQDKLPGEQTSSAACPILETGLPSSRAYRALPWCMTLPSRSFSRALANDAVPVLEKPATMTFGVTAGSVGLETARPMVVR